MESEPGSSKGKPLPSELMGRTPHRVRLTGTGWLYAFASALVIFLAVYFAVKLTQLVNKDKANQISLRQSGVQTMGQMTGESKGLLSYTFEVDGTIFGGRAEVPVDIRDNLHAGDSLPVRYLPATPDVNHPAAWEESPNSDWWGLTFPVFLVFMGFLFVWRFPLQYRVAVNGVPAWACIAEHESLEPSKGQRWESYTFRNAEDEVQFGRCPCDVGLKAGTTVCVLYLPKNPIVSHIYPLDFFEIEQ